VNEAKPADALKQQPLGPPASSPASSSATHLEWHSRGYLPHRDAAGLIQHIVFSLADAIPPTARPPSAIHVDRLLDSGGGTCLLRTPEHAEFVQAALMQADGQRYRLVAWCIMPNDVHVVAEQFPNHRMSAIIQAWKSTSAHNINHRLGRSGRLWRREYFDRFMRDKNHLLTTIEYVEHNPVQARLAQYAADWRWSSARHRHPAGGDAGGPR
jgi:REP element-mobilizing transposase RayT